MFREVRGIALAATAKGMLFGMNELSIRFLPGSEIGKADRIPAILTESEHPNVTNVKNCITSGILSA